DNLPDAVPAITLRKSSGCASPIIGVSPGAAYGGAKRWLPERFAEAAARLAKERGASVTLFGSKDDRALCEQVAALIHGVSVINYAGRTSLAEFIDRKSVV